MEQVYALGIICIQQVQYLFRDSQWYFELVNDISNPYYALEVIFPLVSVLDSVFASQFVLCMAFGQWLNSIMKWWLMEERPYWWVNDTTFYESHNRPQIVQYHQTCETGPGSPSGHSTAVAMQLVLYVMWISHIMNDRKCYFWWWKLLVYPLFGGIMGSVMLARMFVATHFPHQCFLGAIIGTVLSPALCIYVSDAFIWSSRGGVTDYVVYNVFWHVVAVVITVMISAATLVGLKASGIDPHWTLDMASQWCGDPKWIHMTTTPMYALVQATACLLGWAVCVTPAVARYRHYTQRRSLVLAIVAALVISFVLKKLQEGIQNDPTWSFYSMTFLIYTVKPILFIRLVPYLATWPYRQISEKKML